jgi:hypothetical protein
MDSAASGSHGKLVITRGEGALDWGDGVGHQFAGGANGASVAPAPLVQPKSIPGRSTPTAGLVPQKTRSRQIRTGRLAGRRLARTGAPRPLYW